MQVNGFFVSVDDEGKISFAVESVDYDKRNDSYWVCEITTDTVPLFIKALKEAYRQSLQSEQK